VAEAQALAGRYGVRAMMDLSDGLASDLWQMSRASRAVFRVETARIPVARSGRSVYHALMDGEDFELLFTLPPRRAARLPRRIGSCPITRIGSVTRRGTGVEFMDRAGRIRPLIAKGFAHF
jgi:thiamine-monophosphate kinase